MITTETQNMATFACLHCQTQRPYGFTHEDYDPLLNCETCKVPTRHFYIINNRYELVTETRNEQFVSITFARAHNNVEEKIA